MYLATGHNHLSCKSNLVLDQNFKCSPIDDTYSFILFISIFLNSDYIMNNFFFPVVVCIFFFFFFSKGNLNIMEKAVRCRLCQTDHRSALVLNEHILCDQGRGGVAVPVLI